MSPPRPEEIMTESTPMDSWPPVRTGWATRIGRQAGKYARFWDLGLLTLVLAGSYLSITVAEIALPMLVLGLVVFKPASVHRAVLAYPRRFWFGYGGYILWSVLAVAMAVDWRRSLADAKDMYLLLTPVVAMAVVGNYPRKVYRVLFYAILGGAAVNAVVGCYQLIWKYHLVIQHRIVGLQAHYITFAGVLMIAFILLIAFVEFQKPRPWIVWLLVVLGFGVMMVMTMTRSAWLGALTALTALGLLFGWKSFLKVTAGLLVVIGVAWSLAPDTLQDRVTSFIRPSLVSNQTRLWLLQVSVHLVGDYPVTGIGQDNWALVYQNYRLDPMPIDEMPVHFHNTMAQIAVERGLPALFFWLLWYMTTLFEFHHRFSQSMDRRDRWRSAGALAAWIALGVAGFFDYNFGDSEVQMIWLTLPAIGMGPRDDLPK